MCNVEFKAGYYEWNVFVDEYYYTFGEGITENIPYNANKDDMENAVDELIFCMNCDLMNNEKYNGRLPLNDEQTAELKKQMIIELSYYCCDVKI